MSEHVDRRARELLGDIIGYDLRRTLDTDSMTVTIDDALTAISAALTAGASGGGVANADLIAEIQRIENTRLAIGGTPEIAEMYQDKCSTFMHLNFGRLMSALAVGDNEHVRKLVGKLDQWRMCMSHNESYFGEPAGLVKAISEKLARAVDPIYPPQAEPVDPLAGVTIYTATVPFTAITTPASPAAVEKLTPAGSPQECASVTDAVMLAERALWQDDEGVRWVPEAAYQRMVAEVERMETNIAATTQPAAAQGGEWVLIGYEYQHDETGRTTFVELQQCEWGWEKNNERWTQVGPCYRPRNLAAAPQPQGAEKARPFAFYNADADRFFWFDETIGAPEKLSGIVPVYLTPPAHGDGEVANPYEAFGFGELAKQDDLTNPTPEAQEARDALDAVYDDFAAKDNGDVPLEHYPQGAVNALARAGWAVVPCNLPFAVLGDAAQAGVFETGNPKSGWDYLISRTRIGPSDAAMAARGEGE